MNVKQGEFLVRSARKIIFEKLEGRDAKIEFPDWCSGKSGVFVTLTIDGELRGCIGFCEAVLPLKDALLQAAISAAFEDPRFPSLTKEEFGRVTVEVSVLTEPMEIRVDSPAEYPGRVKIGEDGLIVRHGHFNGLLLPQVPVELGWGPEEFLSHTCVKAGLHPEKWRDGTAKFYAFHAEIFSEEAPGGKIVKKKIQE